MAMGLFGVGEIPGLKPEIAMKRFINRFFGFYACAVKAKDNLIRLGMHDDITIEDRVCMRLLYR